MRFDIPPQVVTDPVTGLTLDFDVADDGTPVLRVHGWKWQDGTDCDFRRDLHFDGPDRAQDSAGTLMGPSCPSRPPV